MPSLLAVRIGRFTDIFTSPACEPVENCYALTPHEATKTQDQPQATPVRGADYADIYSEPDCVAIEALYAYDPSDLRKPVPLGAFSVHGDRVIYTPKDVEMSAPPQTFSDITTEGASLADIYKQPDCMTIEIPRASPDERHHPTLLGAYSVHGIETHLPSRHAASHPVSSYRTAFAANDFQRELMELESCDRARLALPKTTEIPCAGPSVASPLCTLNVHGTCMLPPSTPTTEVCVLKQHSPIRLPRSKSWKDLSLDDVVEQAMQFHAAEGF